MPWAKALPAIRADKVKPEMKRTRLAMTAILMMFKRIRPMSA
jgi:hypothetical protein